MPPADRKSGPSLRRIGFCAAAACVLLLLLGAADQGLAFLPEALRSRGVQTLLGATFLLVVAIIPVIEARRLRAERQRLTALVRARTQELEQTNLRLREEIEGREEVEQALRKNEARLREILENSTNVFYAHTLDNEITYISPRVEEVLGVPVEEVPERWTEFATDHPVNLEGIRWTEKAVATGERQEPYELELRRGDGELVRVRVTEAPVVQDGEVVGIVGSLTDITEARRAEEARERLEEQLHRAQRMEAVGRLAAGIAHDFNNILTSIMGHTTLMAMDLTEDHPLRADLTEVESACKRAASLVAQLLAFGGRQLARPAPLDLNRVVQDGGRMLDRLVGDNVQVVLELSDLEPWVLMDQSQLDQILLNLVLNARDSMVGGGVLTITSALKSFSQLPNHWDEPDLDAGTYAVIEVSDTGSGMTEETIERVFEPFFTTKEVGEGSGLGLATVYGIVKQNGGHIEIETAPGKGTTFQIYLPAVDAAAARSQALGESDHPSLESLG